MSPSDPKELLKRYGPREIKILKPDRQLCTTRFSPCGKLLVAGCTDATIRRWDFSDEATPELPPLAGHGGWVQAIAFRPDGSRLFSADSWGQVRCWSSMVDGEGPEPAWAVEAAHEGWIRNLALSPDGQLVATCGHDRKVCLWSADDGKKQSEFLGHGEDVFAVTFHPDGKSLVSGDLKGVVKHWDLASAKAVRTLDAGALSMFDRLQDVGGARRLTFDREGKVLACAGTAPKNGGSLQGTPTILLFDWESGKLDHSLKIGAVSDGLVFDALWHADGFLMGVSSGQPGQGKLFFIRPGDSQPFFLNTKMPNCHAIDAHPDGRRLVVSATNANSNGNGRKIGKSDEYAGNWSPLHLLEMPAS